MVEWTWSTSHNAWFQMFHWKLCLLHSSKGFIDKVTLGREKEHHINMGEMFSFASRRHQWKTKKSWDSKRWKTVLWSGKHPGSFGAWDVLLNINWEEVKWMNLLPKICLSLSLLLLRHVICFKSLCDERRHKQVAHRTREDEKGWICGCRFVFSSGLKTESSLLDGPHLLSST